jgi:ABC-type transport system involved in multi-copper enzyme maturation permease subunit
MLDRSRVLGREMAGGGSPAAVQNIRAQVGILQRRARLLRLAIALVTSTVLCVGTLILGLFGAALLRIEIAPVLVALFCAAITALIGAMIAFLGEINLSLRAAQLDWEFAAKSSTHS